MKITSTCFALFLISSSVLFAMPAQALPVSINTDNYVGFWAVDFSDNFMSGPQQLDLAPGNHNLNIGTVGRIGFTVSPEGLVTPNYEFDGISATGSAGELTLLTIPVPVDPDAFMGDWGISRIREAAPGPDVLQLVPSELNNFSGLIGMEYLVSFGIASSAIIATVRGDGSVTFRDGNNATLDAVYDDSGTIKFRNTNVSISDRDATLTPWSIRQATSYVFGNQDVILVPGVKYLLQGNGAGEFFTVNEPCAISPPTLNLNGVILDIGCGVLDRDGDGIPDEIDLCFDTTPGEIINSLGCSITDLCPCENGWNDHGSYVACTAQETNQFVVDGLITKQTKGTITSQAARSNCGTK